MSKQNESGTDGEGRGSAFVGSIVAAHAVLSEAHLEDWFMDSGASQHMSPKRDWFVNYKKLPTPTQVRVGNGEVILAPGFGEIDILSFNGSKWERNHLTPVLYVPNLKYNLFSMSSALDKGLIFESNHQICQLRRSGITVAVGDRFNDLYKMNFKPYKPHTRDVNPIQAQANIGDNESLRIWHERLAHQNIPHVRQILKKWNIETEPVRNWYCDGCAQGKMSRKPFPTSRSQSKEPGDLIHADLCGPMEHQSIKVFLASQRLMWKKLCGNTASNMRQARPTHRSKTGRLKEKIGRLSRQRAVCFMPKT